MKNKQLSREEFVNICLKRDHHSCVVCKSNINIVVHHIIERKLWNDGSFGYYENNGACLCEKHHLEAEMTTLSVEKIRELCGIAENDKIIPQHLYTDQIYTKWGDPVLPNGKRTRGDLFDDPGVQKILEQGKVLDLYTKYVKYPRTLHLPWSPGATVDDKILKNTDCFIDKEVVVTVKMDGECTSIYNDYIHARSLSDKKHWSKSWIKSFHSKIAHEIPEDMRLVVENLYAEHSISYNNLESYAYGISVWKNLECLAWEESCEWFALLGIPTVPTLYKGIWNEYLIKSLYTPKIDSNECEGYVVRIADSFHYRDFSRSVAKFVRKNHIKTENHWFQKNSGQINKLKNNCE